MPWRSVWIKSDERCRDAEFLDTPQPSLDLAKGATGLGLRSALDQGACGGLLRCYFLRGLRGIREGYTVGEVCRRLQAMQAITW